MHRKSKQDKKEYDRQRNANILKELNKQRLELLCRLIDIIERKCQELGLICELDARVISLEKAEKLLASIYQLPAELRCPVCKKYQIYLDQWALRGKRLVCMFCCKRVNNEEKIG